MANKILDEVGLSHLWGKINNKFATITSVEGLTASDVGADAEGSAAQVLTDAKAYNDAAYANANAYTDQKIADLINGAPTTLDTLGEIATAMADNADVVEALDEAIGKKANQAELDTHTGNDVIHVTADNKTAWDKNTTDIASIVDGTTVVGAATKSTFDGNDRNIVDTYATKESVDNIQTTSKANLSVAGWYRVAVANNVASVQKCDFIIMRGYNANIAEIHTLSYEFAEGATYQIFTKGGRSHTNAHIFTKARVIRDVNNISTYFEVYYIGTYDTNPCAFTVLNSGYDKPWKAITPTLTEETVDGVTVTTTYDIPANASPVTVTELNTPILETAATLPDGLYEYKLGGYGYTGTDLPHKNYAWGYATVYVHSQNYIEVTLHGYGTLKPVHNHRIDGAWLGWDGYLPLSGGKITGNLEISSDTAPYSGVIAEDKKTGRRASFEVTENNVVYLWDYTNNKYILTSNENGVNIFNGSATNANYLNTHNGDEINFKGLTGKESLWFNCWNGDTGVSDETPLKHYVFADKNGGANRIRLMLDQGSGVRDILHTGNKPSGSYTGNGSSEKRTISVGGTGKEVLYIYNWDNHGGALVWQYGAIVFGQNTIEHIPVEQCSFVDGNLILATSDARVNRNGTALQYRVL